MFAYLLGLRELFENQFRGGAVGISLTDIEPFQTTFFVD